MTGLKFSTEILALAVLYWLEGAFPLFKDRKNRLGHAVKNILLGLLNLFVVSLFLSSSTLHWVQWADRQNFGLLHWAPSPKWFQAILALVLFDLWMYVWHVANHKFPWLWRFHRVHHSDDRVDASTALRFHTGEIFLSALARLAVIPLIGMSPIQLIIYELILQPVILFHHSNVALSEKWDRRFRSVFVSPNMHRVHHSRWKAETDSNFASVFSGWDRLGGTYRFKSDVLNLRYGLDEFDARKWQTFSGLLMTPFTKR